MYYLLDENKNPVPCELMEWSQQTEDMIENGTKHVAKNNIGDYWVSTVWLGFDHQYGTGKPLLFETMIQHKGIWTEYQKRYSTWQEAEKGHQKAIQWVKKHDSTTI